MIAMRLPTPSAASAKAGASAVIKWVASGGLLLALIMAVAQCSIERRNTQIALVQTYNLARVASFRDSGAELDKKVAMFADAAAEGRNLSEARQAVRGSLIDHASKALAMKDAFGATETKAYTDDLKGLQFAIEATKDRTTPGPIITALSRVVVSRNRLADAVTSKATS